MRIATAGESHGKGLFAIIEGMPAGLRIDPSRLSLELARRQSGFGRGGRQRIEHDEAEFLSGVRNGVTLGSPIAIAVWNRDYENWKGYMAPEGCDVSARRVTCPRPGHADLAGMRKFGTDDCRDILERASARETAVRVAAGTVCRLFLEELGVSVTGFVRSVGEVSDEGRYSFEEIAAGRGTLLGMMKREEEAADLIRKIAEKGDTLGGTVELRVKGLKSGFGSCMTYAEKLDARLISALMSVQAVKGAEVGLGFALAFLEGSRAHDEIALREGKIVRESNRAGGIEGGMSNGEEIILHAAMKPIPTLARGLKTVDTQTGLPATAARERSDVCAVTALETVLESVLASELAAVVLERLGGDTLDEVRERYGRLPQ